MTNAEKYLKDGVSIDEVAEAFEKFCMNFNNFSIHTYSEEMREFLRADCKSLTEDERVILRNIDTKYKYIGRNGKPSHIYLNDFQYYSDIQGYYPAPFFDHLFQFIKNGEEYNIQDLLSND